jgi:acetolactate synthase-1/2/3 large subunit
MTENGVNSPLAVEDIEERSCPEPFGRDLVNPREHLENVTPAQLLLRYLELEGVTTIFGIPGASLMPVLHELRDSHVLRYVLSRHESGAAYMADGFARVSRRSLGVVMVPAGPGATNALTGAVNAHNSGTSLLTVSSEPAQRFFGQGYLQEGVDCELDVHAVFLAANRYSVLIDDPDNFCNLFQQALRDARSVPGAAVHVGLPVNVSSRQLASVQFPSSPGQYRVVPRSDDLPAVEAIVDSLLRAVRPLILLGNGCRQALRDPRAATRLTEFVERFEIPVMTTGGAKGLFPENHRLSLRNYGLACNPWTEAYLVPPPGAPPYDALLVLGSKLGQLATSPTLWPNQAWNHQLVPAGPFIQVDLDQSVIGRAFPISQGVVADVGRVVSALHATGKDRPVPVSAAGRRAWINRIKASPPPAPPLPGPGAGAAARPNLVEPTDLMSAVNDVLKDVRAAQIFIDCGNCVGWSLRYLEISPPTELHTSLAMAPMGFAVCAVVGAKLAQPSQACVAITGDAAFLMHGSEVSTAAHYGVAAVWVVLDDGSHVMADQGMAANFPKENWDGYYSIGRPDLAAYARSLGALATTVSTRDQLRPALTEAFTSTGTTPRVVVVAIDPEPVPPFYTNGSAPLRPAD